MRYLIAGVLVLCVAAVSAKPPKVDDVIHVVDGKGGWETVKVSEYKPYKVDKDIYKVNGILVEMHLGYAGIDRVTAILCKYSENKNDAGLIVYDESKDIALLYYKRWNNLALNVAAPDADEIIQRHGFKCTALDVCRLLRALR